MSRRQSSHLFRSLIYSDALFKCCWLKVQFSDSWFSFCLMLLSVSPSWLQSCDRVRCCRSLLHSTFIFTSVFLTSNADVRAKTKIDNHSCWLPPVPVVKLLPACSAGLADATLRVLAQTEALLLAAERCSPALRVWEATVAFDSFKESWLRYYLQEDNSLRCRDTLCTTHITQTSRHK